MALLFPWATKEYLLWEMSIGQIVMYHNIGAELKYGEGKTGPPGSLRDKSQSELREKRQELIDQGLLEDKQGSDENKEQYRDKYGDV